MKPSIYSIFIFLLTSIHTFGQWTKVGNFEFGQDRTVMEFTEHGGFLFAGMGNSNFQPFEDSLVFRSGDGGLTWENISDGLTPGTVVAFETIGDTLFVGLYTEDTFETLHMSTDFGDTWQLVESFTYGEIFALQAFDNNLIALTDPGGYVLSTDRGATWSQNVQGLGVDNDTGGAPKKFTKMGETLYATTAQGVAYSEDKGHNWTYPENNGLPEIQGNKVTSTIFTFADTLFAGAASLDNPGGLYFSTDKGTNWEYLSNDLQDLYPSSLIKLDSGYAISTVGSIGILESSGVYYSPDKGETWQNITEGLPRPPEILITDINAMAAHEGKLFVGVQSDGLYYYSTNPPETVTGIESSIDGEDFAAFNYPNPFTDYTTISFKTNKAGKVKITVYDMHGNLISQPVSNVYPSGLHSIKFNAEGLKDGVYFYRIELDEAVARSGRMVLRR